MQTEQIFGVDVQQQQQRLRNGRSASSEPHRSGIARFATQRHSAHQPVPHAAIGSRGEFGMFMIQD